MDDTVKPYLLSGLKVVDAATVIAAPAAAMMLADFGADVIKVEQPGSGDMLRMIPTIAATPGSGDKYLWHMDAHNKRSITLNLRTEAGLEVMRKLAVECDVFITNQPHPARERLGLTYDALREANPGMIYASLTAYARTVRSAIARASTARLLGAQWPHGADARGRDDADPGAPRHGRSPDGGRHLCRHRHRVAAPGTDGRGRHGAYLAARERTLVGVGCRAGGDGGWGHVGLSGEATGTGVPDAPYRCSDGRWLQFNMVRTEELLYLLLAAMDAMHVLADERFATWEAVNEHRLELGEVMRDIVAQRPSDAWLAAFEAMELPVNRIALVEESVTDPQVLENAMAVPVDEAEFEMPLLLTHPIRVSSVPQVRAARGPQLGEHSEEILRELGYDAEAIAAMREQGAL